MDAAKLREFVANNLDIYSHSDALETNPSAATIDAAADFLMEVTQRSIQHAVPWARPSELGRLRQGPQPEGPNHQPVPAEGLPPLGLGGDQPRHARDLARGQVGPQPRGRAANTIPTLNGPHGPADTTEAKAEVLRESLFPEPPPADLFDIERRTQPPQIEFPEITKEEVAKAIQRAPPDKAPRPDAVPNKVWHELCKVPVFLERATTLFNASIKTGHNPRHFQTSTTVALRKGGPRDYRKPKSYRPVALLNTFDKILESIIATRIAWALEKHKLLRRTHLGGRKGVSTDHVIQLILDNIYRAWGQGKKVSMVLLDVSGAFDNVSHARLLFNLRQLKLGHFADWLQSFLTARTTRISLEGEFSAEFPTPIGIPQGSPLSPILYLIYNTPLIQDLCVRRPQGGSTTAFGWIDDACTLAVSDTYAENVLPGGWQAVLVVDKSFLIGLSSVDIWRLRGTRPDGDHFYGHNNQADGNGQVLGGAWDAGGPQRDRGVHVGGPTAGHASDLPGGGRSPAILCGCGLVQSQGRPDRGLDQPEDAGGIRSDSEASSAANQRGLQRHLCSGWTPMEALSRKGGPLWPLGKKKWETRKPYILAPWEPPVATAIDSYKAVLVYHRQYYARREGIAVYTDGSGLNGRIGASTVCLSQGWKRNYMLETEEESTVYAGELTGIRMALHRLRKETRPATVFVDSQAAIQAVRNPQRPSGQYILGEIYYIVRRYNMWNRIQIRWIPAHIGVLGNEAADEAAREGTQKVGGTICLAAAAKRQIRRRIKDRWTREWKAEKTGRTTHKLVEIPNKRVLDLYKGLPKPHASIIIQMRTQRNGLKHFLFKIKVSDLDQCHCGKAMLEKLDPGIRRKMDYNGIISHPQAMRYIAEFIH
ncbi:putative reverse transcriptase [Aspergillus flavus AF70]|nr:putative reverse transcriptase [Aspergillus flavus AF70]